VPGKNATSEQMAFLAAEMHFTKYVENLLTANTMMKSMNEKGHYKYPQDFLPSVPKLKGIYLDAYTDKKCHITLEDAFDDAEPLWLGRTIFFIGKAGGGKSNLLHSLAREVTYKLQGPLPHLDRYGFSKALDPWGLLTKSDAIARCAVFCFTDFLMKSRISNWLEEEEMKGFLKIDEVGTIPARYHPATFPEMRPKFCAVNSSLDDEGNVDFGATGRVWTFHMFC
jgi:hypothetical protein